MSVTKWKVHFRVLQRKADSECREGEGHPTSPPLAPFSPSSACSELSSATQCPVVYGTKVTTVLLKAETLCIPNRISQQQ